MTQIAAEALATLGALDPAASLNAAARAGLAEHWDAHFDAAAARGLAQLVMDPSSNVSWRAAHALEVPGRDALWPGDDVAEALGRHGTERAIWWHFRLACAHPARLQHPLPADMPAWATCARCRHLPASSGGPLPPHPDRYRGLEPPIPWETEEDAGVSVCPDCGRVYGWSVTVDPRDLFPTASFSFHRLTPAKARQHGVPTPDRSEGYRACLAHPEAWVRKHAQAALEEP